MWQGWTGIVSLVVNPVVIVANLVNLARMRRLAPPAGGPGVPSGRAVRCSCGWSSSDSCCPS
ncbi:hypothetical protein GCM10025734_08680 [Kitasatospora paranensis]